MNNTSLLELSKKLNILRRNCMKTKEELEEAIKDTITRYKEIILSSDTPACMACLDELRRQQAIADGRYDGRSLKMEDTMVDGRYDEEARMRGTSKKYRDGW